MLAMRRFFSAGSWSSNKKAWLLRKWASSKCPHSDSNLGSLVVFFTGSTTSRNRPTARVELISIGRFLFSRARFISSAEHKASFSPVRNICTRRTSTLANNIIWARSKPTLRALWLDTRVLGVHPRGLLYMKISTVLGSQNLQKQLAQTNKLTNQSKTNNKVQAYAATVDTGLCITTNIRAATLGAPILFLFITDILIIAHVVKLATTC
mmetsp:Transcript_16081/g.30969  ORF Transcript_16081/g.30969 Transcript_16081/m.30969 type:complete len:209 (-) Transcript_16081:255-881(-)